MHQERIEVFHYQEPNCYIVIDLLGFIRCSSLRLTTFQIVTVFSDLVELVLSIRRQIIAFSGGNLRASYSPRRSRRRSRRRRLADQMSDFACDFSLLLDSVI